MISMQKRSNIHFNTDTAIVNAESDGLVHSGVNEITHPSDGAMMVLIPNGDVDGHPTWRWVRG